jgi:hypothetical protein
MVHIDVLQMIGEKALKFAFMYALLQIIGKRDVGITMILSASIVDNKELKATKRLIYYLLRCL